MWKTIYKPIKLRWYRESRPDPPLKKLSPDFFWKQHCQNTIHMIKITMTAQVLKLNHYRNES